MTAAAANQHDEDPAGSSKCKERGGAKIVTRPADYDSVGRRAAEYIESNTLNIMKRIKKFQQRGVNMPARGRMSFLSRTVSAAVLAAALSVPAYAQLAENAAPEVAPKTVGGEEIIVTGLKRDQSYIDAPVAVQVFNQKAIEEAGITSPSDFLNVTPNVTFIQSNFPGESFVNIRGQAAARRGESSVAFVIDGVQLPTQDGFNGDLFDLNRSKC